MRTPCYTLGHAAYHPDVYPTVMAGRPLLVRKPVALPVKRRRKRRLKKR